MDVQMYKKMTSSHVKFERNKHYNDMQNNKRECKVYKSIYIKHSFVCLINKPREPGQKIKCVRLIKPTQVFKQNFHFHDFNSQKSLRLAN